MDCRLAGEMSLLLSWPAITYLTSQSRNVNAGNKLYFLVTEADMCERLAQSGYLTATRRGVKPTLSEPVQTPYPLHHQVKHVRQFINY